ncbi:ribbon-helix-helix domain-containing protein [Pseudolactococcus reticulitermitis]|uniref:Ribbon-helix-helix protein CopG domain-containing protein n=1 Tax=Pseudolactococcus reticulitermitis TaxID=2025039 RepID=A0A224XCE5_9LACT|nr:CopG family transcriptional regulator [Lactococcus reticulitermitis]GAX47303.1 hypothetical protein RsY01_902 [Lactococcus reticulitermitis]
MGRPPSSNPKGVPTTIRLDEKTDKFLKKYSEIEKVSKAETVRRGLEKLEKEWKK